jgi:hypothetical protein
MYSINGRSAFAAGRAAGDGGRVRVGWASEALIKSTFFSFTANAGFLYVSGSVCFVLAVLAPFIPFYMPLVAGSLMSLNMTTIGLFLHRVARETTTL